MAAKLRVIASAATFLMINSPFADAQTAPIRYTLSFPAPHTHYVEVAGEFPTDGRPSLELMMAVWTPGSYLVREYSRHVEAVSAADAGGRPLAVEKSDKNRWRVTTGGAPTVAVRYRVYAREMSVRTNWVEAGFAMINGAPTFLTPVGAQARPHEVTIVPASGWNRSMTGLAELPGGPHRYRAPDYDTLVDSPILVGNPAVHEFTVDGKKHYLVNQGEAGVFDGARAARDVERLVQAHRSLWGELPYDKYVVLNVLTVLPGQVAGGGLEHKNSTLLMGSPWATRTRTPYLRWLELVSHELFHVWNVKRLRPVELGPFNYEEENHTRSLWIAEGVTEYYGLLLVHRAGLSTREDLLGELSDVIEEIQTFPGSRVQSAELASFDAWIKYYRPDENSANVTASYYTKGAVLALVLDARIRQATGGARSLDDVMRAAYAKYSGARGFTPEEFRQVAEQVAGADLKPFWASAVEGTADLDYAGVLAQFGLRFKDAPLSTKPWLGVTTRNDAGRLLVSTVRRGSPAFEAGLNVDDEILAIGDFRVRAERFDDRMEQYTPGDRVSVLLARREQLLRLDVTLGPEPPRQWRLEVDPQSSDAQKGRLAGWLQGARAQP